MQLSTVKKNYDIWNLFVPYRSEVIPFDALVVANRLNEMAISSYPDVFFKINPPSLNGLTHWNVWFAMDRYKTLSDGLPDFDIYPKRKVSYRDEMVRSIPEQLVAILDHLNGMDFLV